MTRLDQVLVQQNFVVSRSRACDLIKRGLVQVDSQICRKPSRCIQEHIITVDDFPWVSRAGLKLENILTTLPGLIVAGRYCLDLGASTGGFSEVLLAKGAAHVLAVDVGTEQLHPRLLHHPRLRNLPGTDVRDLTASHLDPMPDLLVCDLSFIALHKAIGTALNLTPMGSDLIALVKPQFEVGRACLGAGGIVRDSKIAANAVKNFRIWLESQGWVVYVQSQAAITGRDGNQETWVAATKRYKG